MMFVSRLFGKKEESLPRRAGAGECADDSGSAGHDILDPMMGHFMGRCIGAVRESGLKAEGTGGCSILLGGDGGPELALGPFWGRYQASQDEGVFASVVESAQRMMELGPAPTLEQPCPDDSERRACAAADEPVVPVFIPPLVTLLVHHEREKGSPLTRE